MKVRSYILIVVAIVLANVAALWLPWRIDLTSDHRHSLSKPTKQLLRSLDGEIEVEMLLNGNLNSGFARLRNATRQMMSEFAAYSTVRYNETDVLSLPDAEQQQINSRLMSLGLNPTVIYERDNHGRQTETMVYPFCVLRLNGREQWVPLLHNQRGQSGAENLNSSVEGLEYAFAEAISLLRQTERQKIVFLEGHGELPEMYTQDVQTQLSRWFDVFRGQLTADADCLSDFAAVVISDPQMPFTEQDKYIIDQYIMNGGKVLWMINGVRFSEQVFEDEGYTPVLPMELNLTDMLFRYGVRVNQHLVQDMHCLPLPVDVSQNPEQPQYQLMPWCYAPLLLTNPNSPITHGLTEVSATFCSDIDAVGNDQQVLKQVLLSTSDASRLVSAPSKVDLSDIDIDYQLFRHQYVPVAMSLQGQFGSLFEYRMAPENINITSPKQTISKPTKQIVAAAGSIARNDLQQGKPLPAGYDKYSRLQAGNRDFVVNSVLWLTDDNGVINLRQKTLPLRLLNANKCNKHILIYQLLSTLLPIILLVVVWANVVIVRKRKYAI